jgi:hypothetical protein
MGSLVDTAAGSGSALGAGAGKGSALGAGAGNGSALGAGAGNGSAVGAGAGNGSALGACAGSGSVLGVGAGGDVAGGTSNGWVGIDNTSAIFCYSNSILQCLAHVYLICPQEFKYLTPSPNSLYNSLMSVVRDLSEKKVNMESVWKFRSSTLSHLPASEHARMQDVREILLQIFENAHTQDITFLSCFSTLRSTVFICPTCATVHEGYADIVQIIDVNSFEIQSQVDGMLTGEVPPGYKCDTCGKINEVVKRSVITSLPFCLCFSVNTRVLQKKVPTTIVLKEYSNCTYNLVSVALHQAHSQIIKAESKSGHYISIFRDNALFCLANEDLTRFLTEAETDKYLCPNRVGDFKPYLLFYCIDSSCIDQLISVKYSGDLSNIVNALYLLGQDGSVGFLHFYMAFNSSSYR